MARMTGSRLALCLGLVMGFAFPTYSQQTNPNPDTTNSNANKVRDLQKQLDDLKLQMEKIEGQIQEMSKPAEQPNAAPAQAAIPAPTSATTPAKAAVLGQGNAAALAAELGLVPKNREVGKATSSYQTDSEDQISAPRVDNAPLDPRYPGYFRLPSTETLLRIGGYFKTDFIYDLKPAGNTDSFIPATFPIPAPVAVNNTTISVRPTRINLDFLTPVKDTSVRFFLEMDFFGTNATTPRLRHAYAQVKNILVGQTFSNFMDPDAGPDTLDFQGPAAQISIRNPQFRYSVPLADKTSLSFSVEKASSDVSFTTPLYSSLPNSPTPDGAINFRHGFEKGHVQFSMLMRSPAAYLPDGRHDSVFGWGLNLSGAWQVVGKDTLVYQGAYGAGYERYVNDTSGLGIDAAPKDTTQLKAVPLTAVYGAYQHYWTKQLRSSAVYSFDQVENTPLEPGSTYHQGNYSAANLIWNPFGSLNVGAEFLYGWIVEEDKQSANAPRFMFSAKYSFIKSTSAK
jgi:DcaP outer membrane protein